MIVSASGRILGTQATQAAYISHELPSLMCRQCADHEYSRIGALSAKRRHSVGSPTSDRFEDFLRRKTVNPFNIHQCWTYPSTAVGVTSIAIEGCVQSFAFGKCVGII